MWRWPAPRAGASPTRFPIVAAQPRGFVWASRITPSTAASSRRRPARTGLANAMNADGGPSRYHHPTVSPPIPDGVRGQDRSTMTISYTDMWGPVIDTGVAVAPSPRPNVEVDYHSLSGVDGEGSDPWRHAPQAPAPTSAGEHPAIGEHHDCQEGTRHRNFQHADPTRRHNSPRDAECGRGGRLRGCHHDVGKTGHQFANPAGCDVSAISAEHPR